MRIKLYTILIFLTVILLGLPHSLWAQQAEENSTVLESYVRDENGNGIKNAEIFSNSAYSLSDGQGKFTIEVSQGAQVIIKADGYEKITLSMEEAMEQDFIEVVKVYPLYSSEDKVQLAFRKVAKGDVVSAVSTANPAAINAVDNNIWANNVLSGRTLGMLGGNSIRGIGIGINTADITGSGLFSGNALFVVDGLPRDIQSLRLTEIESITVLKDVNSAILYGSAGVNGVILLTTKRGEAYKQTTNFTVNSGISSPRATPNYLNSADYMTYYDIARQNDGLPEQFGSETIENFRSGNPYRYPDVDYYSDEYLKSSKSFFDVVGEFSGGNENARYYTNLGWNSSGSLLDFGEGANARNNAFNVRGNVDLKVNDFIKTSIDGNAIFVNNKGPRGNYWSRASSIRPHEYSPLFAIKDIDPDNELLLGRKNDVNGQYLLGGNSNYLSTPFGDGYSGGQLEAVERKFSFNNRIDIDLARLLDGLSAHTNISFDYYTRFDQTIANQYSVYEAIWSDTDDSIVDLKQHGVDARPGTQIVGNSFFRRRIGFYGLLSYDKKFDERHHFTGSFLGYGSNFKEEGDFQGVKQAHLGLQAGYALDGKYMVDFSAAYVNSVKLPEGNRLGFSPSLGLAWMVSKEDFLASAESIDYLKLRVSAGTINSDLPIGGFFYYDNRYGGSGSYNWYEGIRNRGGVRSNWSSNPNLGFAKRNEINFGVEGMFFKNLIGIEANVFYDLYNDLIARPVTKYPSFYTDFIPYENFGADKYQGLELGLSINKSIGNWNFILGTNLLYVTSERTKVDEVYNNDYQYRKGQPRDATFGLEALGLFQSQQDIDNSPIQSFGSVQPGDIKYKDQNNDGIIDANDEVYLRRWQSPFSGGVTLQVSFKNLSLFVLGEGGSGAKNFREGNYYWIDGNKKYSDVVLNSWTPETAATADYPRLSTQSSSNNFRRSSYWLYDNDYFSIRTVQLTYDMPISVIQGMRMKGIKIFVDATDLIQFAKNKEIREIRVGSEPYYRTFSVGLKADF